MVGWNLGDWAYRVAEAEQLPGGRKASSIERAAADWAPPGELPATPVSGKNTHLGNTHLGLGLGLGGLGLGHELRDRPPCNNGSPRPTGWLPISFGAPTIS